MSLPVKLSPGIVSIYGTPSTQGIDLTNSPRLQFGGITQLPYTYGAYSVGQNALFDIGDAKTVYYNNVTYFLLPEDKIIFTENPPS